MNLLHGNTSKDLWTSILNYSINGPQEDVSLFYGKADKLELPFANLKVRRGMNMAINKQVIVDEYCGGNATLCPYPCPPLIECSLYYIPLEEMPESVQELFEYIPEKARQLLAEAGYLNCIKANFNTTSAFADLCSLLREYLLQVGIDLEIEPMEPTARSAYLKTTDELFYSGICRTTAPNMLENMRPGQIMNYYRYIDDEISATITAINSTLGKDDVKVKETVRGIVPHLLDVAWALWMLGPYTYNMWWPWIHNYYGVWNLGFSTQFRPAYFWWVDPDLKKSMGY